LRTTYPDDNERVNDSNNSSPIRGSDGMAGLAKGIAVLEFFSQARTPLTISDVARTTDMSKPAVRRCLMTLTELGYLRFDGRRYIPTRRVLRLGSAYFGMDSLSSIAQPLMDELRDELQESIALATWDDWEMVIVARADANRIMSPSGPVGRRLPGYCTATGRILLAGMPPAEVAQVLASHPPVPHSQLTVVDPAEIVSLIDSARARGYAIVDGETEVGFLSVAAPIMNAQGETIAALTVNSSSQRVGASQVLETFLPALQQFAERISRLT
jgi:IclR family pca regulon transcriptional regulator